MEREKGKKQKHSQVWQNDVLKREVLMEKIYFSMQAKIYFERGVLERYLPEIKNYGRRILIVSGKSSIFKSGLYDRIANILSENGIEFTSYSDVRPEPDTDDVERGVEACKNCDCILAVGGGSAMDAGKAIAVMIPNRGSVKDYFGEVEYKNEPLPVVAVPTTCGTGSEVTRFAVIVDRQAQTKKTINSEKIIPRLSILDADLLQTLPQKLVMATGMDAFSHSAESFLSSKADYISRMFAKDSLKLLMKFLPEAYADTGNTDAVESLFLASLLAGLAINRTGTIIVHGMGYSLTVKHNIHHGTANAILLPYVFEYLKENGYGEEISELEEVWGDTDRLKDFVKSIGLPSSLKEAGLRESDLDELADLSLIGAQRALRNMRIKIDRDDFRKILQNAF
jgi:alcohol dehydrogenase class IV